MKLVVSLFVLSCCWFEGRAYPHPVFTSSGNVDTWSYGDASHGGRVFSRSHNPYAIRRAVRTPPAYPLWQPEAKQRNYPLTHHQAFQYQQADRRRQAFLEVNDTPPQENEVYFPQAPETIPIVPDEATELITPVKQAVVPTTEKAIVPEIEPEIQEAEEKPEEQAKKTVQKKTQARKPVEEEDDDEDDYSAQKFLSGAVFPMFFGWSGSGPVAVANAYSTGKGGAAASEATAYGAPPLRTIKRLP